jgi:transcriptional regulator with XRE-family HTH domain
MKTTKPFQDLLQLSGLTQTKFAERFKIPKQMVNDWKLGRKNCKVETIQSLANQLGYKLNVNFKIEKL